MGKLGDKLPKNFIDEMRKKLEASPPEIQKAWNNMVGDLRIVDPNWKGNPPIFYSPKKRGVFFDINDVKNAVYYNGIKLAPEHSKTFHELFHNLSHAASLRNGIDKDFSNVFISIKYKGMTLSQMLKQEADDKINSVLKSLKDEAVKNGLKRSSVLKKDAINYLRNELQNIPDYKQFFVSDIWEGATNGIVKGKYGHLSKQNKDYWIRHSVGTEATAIMGDVMVTEPSLLKVIQGYFPKSYEIFLEMLSSIGGIK